MNPQHIYQDIAQQLAVENWDSSHAPQERGLLPSPCDISRLMELLREAMFPMIYCCHSCQPDTYAAYLQVLIADTDRLLSQQIQLALLATSAAPNKPLAEQQAHDVAHAFLQQLPEIRRLLMADVEAIAHNDPAASSQLEIISCYPAITAMLHHRTAHALHMLHTPLLPRIISERAHSLTGIDIHPAAQIGQAFGIDHGTGIVIGASAIIGSNVMIYQGVTLGARNFRHDAHGHLIDEPRHPVIEDHVTIYSNTSVLGRIRVGHHSVIGGNLWITRDVPPHSRVRQSDPISQPGFADGAGI